MRFEEPLLEGTLIRRYRRFLADVKLDNGDQITAHCANPGSMLGCSEPGSRVLVSVHENPRRRFKHQLEIIFAGKTAVGIHTGRPHSLVAEAVAQGKLPQLAGYATLRRDAGFGRDNRVDLLLEGNGLRSCYVDVENVTLAQDGTAYYPDAVNQTAARQMTALTDLVREGNRAMVLFVAQRADVERLRPADEIDPDFGQALRDASARGVEVLCYRAKVTKKGIEVDTELPVELGD